MRARRHEALFALAAIDPHLPVSIGALEDATTGAVVLGGPAFELAFAAGGCEGYEK